MWNKVLVLLFCAVFAAAGRYYNESLDLKPLPRNKLLASFQFNVESLPFDLKYYDTSAELQGNHHYTYFPRALGPIIESTNTRELHLRFTQGWWDSESWGRLPSSGFQSGGTGVEVSALIEARDVQTAKANWFKLTKTLSGFFCASLNFIDDSITTFPKHAASSQNHTNYSSQPKNKLFFIRAALPSEPICTENLTPFLKLLPTRGKSGVSSLLDGHKVFDSLWHGMSIDVRTDCDSKTCSLKMLQSVNQVVDIIRSKRKKEEGGLPKPTPGNKLRCDDTKTFNAWQCFPLSDPTNLEWSLETIYGRRIIGPAFADDPESTVINVDTEPSTWKVGLSKNRGDVTESYHISGPKKNHISEYLREQVKYDFQFETSNSSVVNPIKAPPLYVTRSLTGYSQDKGGLRVTFTNPSDEETVDFVYFESLPWFMRLYLHTLTVEVKKDGEIISNAIDTSYIKDRFYKPAVDRKRPSHLELSISIPPKSSLTLTYQFDKSLLLYHEYPPDANHGFAIEPAVVTIFDKDGNDIYEARTTSLLLTLPTPDFSMPYNVIILTCTVMSLAFGTIFNLLIKKVITEEEMEEITKSSKINIAVAKIKSRVQQLKALIKPKKE
ncbi:GPI transamidase component PIG-T [Scheffersomyces xylosifermentans]|uniref:GPI transamidase component PIG-T n=1 Tax=Scheffersomyces xylosifermentans TaxID=1304137 RepID=UPI00315D99E3